MVSKLLVVTL